MSAVGQLQDDVAARLQDGLGPDVPVLAVHRGVTVDANKQALGIRTVTASGKTGLSVQVLMPSRSVDYPDVPGPMYKVELVVRVVENPILNSDRDNRSADAIGEKVDGLLHQVGFGPVSLTSAGQEPVIVADDGSVGYDCKYTFERTLPPARRVATPTIAADGSITCNTGGADIWFTTDGSYPAPTNATATLYSAPVAGPAFIRAVAYFSGLQASSVDAVTIS